MHLTLNPLNTGLQESYILGYKKIVFFVFRISPTCYLWKHSSYLQYFTSRVQYQNITQII